MNWLHAGTTALMVLSWVITLWHLCRGHREGAWRAAESEEAARQHILAAARANTRYGPAPVVRPMMPTTYPDPLGNPDVLRAIQVQQMNDLVLRDTIRGLIPEDHAKKFASEFPFNRSHTPEEYAEMLRRYEQLRRLGANPEVAGAANGLLAQARTTQEVQQRYVAQEAEKPRPNPDPAPGPAPGLWPYDPLAITGDGDRSYRQRFDPVSARADSGHVGGGVPGVSLPSAAESGTTPASGTGEVGGGGGTCAEG